MTTEQLRKEIEVANWHINYAGISITYYRTYENKTNPIAIDIKLDPEECARRLSAIGSIDSWCDYDGQIEIYWEQDSFMKREMFNVFSSFFKLCQWEALTLAIRHELEKETEKEIDNGDIGKSIDSITK